MSENSISEQKPVEYQEKTDDQNVTTNNSSSMSEKIEDFVCESRNLLENSIGNIKENIDVDVKEVNSLSSSFENQTIQEQVIPLESFENQAVQQQVKSMEIDENVNIDEDKTNDVIPEESKEDEAIACKSIPNNETKDTEKECEETKDYAQLVYEWTKPKLLCSSTKEFKATEKCENFTKGCHWSPDGTCIMVPSEDFRIRIFDLPRDLYSGKLPENFQVDSYESSVKIKEGGLIYDSCWFPYMSSWDPSTCCFLSTSQGSPIHLWDAFNGQLRATYRAYNQVDEVEAAISLQFTDCGGKIWSGFKNALRVFDTNAPGRQLETIYLKKDFPNVTGLVSCIRENPGMSGLIAFGTYSKYIGLYKDGPLCSFETSSGVTQIEFSPCGTKLYSAVRRGDEFLCWDLRNPGTVLYSLQNRQSDTNQRIHFSLSYSGEEIVSGGTDGAARIWKIPNDLQLEEDLEPAYKIQISRKDTVNGVNLHKNLPILAVSTGSRICDDDENENKNRDNSFRLYWLGDR